MKKFFANPIVIGIGLFILILGVLIPLSKSRGADYTLGNDLNWGPPGESRNSAIDKLETRDENLLSLINLLKDSNAGDSAPVVAGQDGQFWYESDDDEVYIYHNGWQLLWDFDGGDDPNWLGEINAPSGSVDNFYANTITTPYADVTEASVGSATANTLDVTQLTTANWSQDVATFTTCNVNNHISTYNNPYMTFNRTMLEVVWADTYTDVVDTDGAWHTIDWNSEVTDAMNLASFSGPGDTTISINSSSINKAIVCFYLNYSYSLSHGGAPTSGDLGVRLVIEGSVYYQESVSYDRLYNPTWTTESNGQYAITHCTLPINIDDAADIKLQDGSDFATYPIKHASNTEYLMVVPLSWDTVIGGP